MVTDLGSGAAGTRFLQIRAFPSKTPIFCFVSWLHSLCTKNVSGHQHCRQSAMAQRRRSPKSFVVFRSSEIQREMAPSFTPLTTPKKCKLPNKITVFSNNFALVYRLLSYTKKMCDTVILTLRRRRTAGMLNLEIQQSINPFQRFNILTFQRVLFPNRCLQLRFESFNDLCVRRIHFSIRQRFFRRTIYERIGHALLSFGHILAAKHVKQFYTLQIRRFRLFDRLQHSFVRRRPRHQDRRVPADRRKLGQGFE
jgi:hypothetical protein